ncbi:hypothetical protein FGB62_213g08 [Gracilaria domingensis]|nr:hypothetical protein FGB62_213g08 [Gracilaria domingensis]
MRAAGRVKSPTLPPLPPAAIPTLTPLSPLQDALRSVLQNSVIASEPCTELINKKNCSRSLPEWKAAHDLLVLAITDCHIDPEHPDGKLYFWKDQLYCTVTDLTISNHEDKRVVFHCLHKAKQMNLIDSADAYIQGIHQRQSVNSELFVLKKACLTLFERLTTLETTIGDLRSAFDAYRQQQLVCNVIAIALKLIPIAGGAVSNALEVAAELCGELSGADVVEYSLSTASAILEQCNFSTLSETKQAQIVCVFEEYGFTKEQVRCLFYNRASVTLAPTKNDAPLPEAFSPSYDSDQFDHRGESKSGLDSHFALFENTAADESDFNRSDPNESESDFCDADSREYASNEIDFVLNGDHSIRDKEKSQERLNRYDSTMATAELAKTWTHFVLNASNNSEELFGRWNECLKHFLLREKVSPRTLSRGRSCNISRFTNKAREFVQCEIHPPEMKIGYKLRMVQFVHQYVQQHTDQPTLASGNLQAAIVDMACEWTQFVFGSSDAETRLRSSLNDCLVQFLEECCISPPSIKFGSKSDIEELQGAVEQCIEDNLGEELTEEGYYINLTYFVTKFSHDG